MGLFSVDIDDDGTYVRASRGAPQLLLGALAPFAFGGLLAVLSTIAGPDEESGFNLVVGVGFVGLSLASAMLAAVMRWEVDIGPDGVHTHIHPFGFDTSHPMTDVRGLLIDREVTENKNGGKVVRYVLELHLADGHTQKLLPTFRRHQDAIDVRDALQVGLARATLDDGPALDLPVGQRAT